ncbi:MAG: hypothetical protein ACI4L1_03050 [Christensenellales bacterium]
MTFIDRIKASGKDFNTFKSKIQEKFYDGFHVHVEIKNGLPYIEVSSTCRFKIFDFHVEMSNLRDENLTNDYEKKCSEILSLIFEDYAEKKEQYDAKKKEAEKLDQETYKKFYKKFDSFNEENKNKCKEMLNEYVSTRLAKGLEIGEIIIDESGINIPVSSGSFCNSGAFSTAFTTKAVKHIFRGAQPEQFCKEAVHELYKKVIGNDYIDALKEYNDCKKTLLEMEGNAKKGELCEQENLI